MSNNQKNLPSEWQMKKLGDTFISEIIKAGGTPLRSIKDYWDNGDIPFVKIEDMTSSDKYLYKTNEKTTKKGLNNSSAWIIPENSILYSMYASYGEAVINKIPVSTNQAIIAIKPSNNIDVDYLYYSLNRMKYTIHKYIRETTQKNLNAEIVRNFDIPVPPLVEQRGIAEVLRTVDEAIRQTNSIIEKADELKRGLMQRLLTRGIGHTEFKQTELGEIPKTWEIKRIEEVSSIITDGVHKTPKYVDTGIPFISVNNMNGRNIDWNGCKYISLDEHIELTKRCKPEKNDVLLSKVGTLGLTYVVKEEFDFSIFVQIALIKPNLNIIDSYYLKYVLDTNALQKAIFNNSSGSTLKYIGINKRSNNPIT